MQWYYGFQTEYGIAAGLFVLLCIGYGWRFRRVALKMQSKNPLFWTKFLLRSAYFTLLLMASLGPSLGKAKREIKTFGKDIFLVVDLSESMNASDVQPSRLERAKFEVLQWIENWKTDRIGLIVFADEAFVQCPLTFDKNALTLFIKSLDTRQMPRNGTNVAESLQLAVAKLSDNEQLTQNTSKIVVLVSDGEDFSGNLPGMMSEISAKGLRLFTVGIGTIAGSRILQNGQWKKDKQGNPVVSRLNRNVLQELSRQTGGSYLEISQPSLSGNMLLEAVSQVKGQLRDVQEIDVSANKYDYFLLAALLLICLDVLITVRVMEL